MLQQKIPEDFVIASGRMESVRKFIEITADKLGWKKDKNKPGIIWKGKGINEIGVRYDTGDTVVKVDKMYFRPSEVEELKGDPTKAFEKLGWIPDTTLEELIDEMVKVDKQEIIAS